MLAAPELATVSEMLGVETEAKTEKEKTIQIRTKSHYTETCTPLYDQGLHLDMFHMLG